MPRDPPFKNGKPTFNVAMFYPKEIFTMARAWAQLENWAKNPQNMQNYKP
jgi:hypothetical protein